MANEMPSSENYSGLSRVVLRYSEAFTQIVNTSKTAALTDADWHDIEQLVDTEAFVRMGVFLGPQAEILGWAKYKFYISQYARHTDWEGTLRDITQSGSRVILELEERNTRDGVTHVSNTVTTYAFSEAGKLRRLEVYVMPLQQ